MSDYSKLQACCQRGESSLAGANNLLAECHAALGQLTIEIDKLKTEREVLRKDAERFRHLMFNHVDWVRNGKDDDAVMLEFGPYPSHKLRDTIDAAMLPGDQS